MYGIKVNIWIEGRSTQYSIIMFVLLILALIPACPATAKAESEKGGDFTPWNIEADKITTLKGEGLYLAEGRVVISRGDRTITADRARYNERTGMVKAEGNILLTTPGELLKCDRGTFNLNDETGRILNGSLFLKENHFYIRGKMIKKTGPRTYTIDGCRVTSCDGENPDWSITGSRVKVTIEGYGTIKNAAFYIRHVPLLYFPYIIFPAKKERQTGFLTPSMGHSDRNGMDIEIPFFWAISENTDATFYERYMTERGLMQGLEFRYIAGPQSRGAFLFDILSDKKEEKDMHSQDSLDVSPYKRTNQTRYWLRGRSDHSLSSWLDARLDLDLLSDYDYLREFREPSLGLEYREELDEISGRPLNEVQSPYRRSALLVHGDLEDYSIQGEGGFYQRPDHPDKETTAQPLGNLGFSMLPERVLDLPVFFSLDSNYGYVYREAGQRGRRLSISPSVAYPVWSVPYLEIEPFARYLYTCQWLKPYKGHDGGQEKKSYELGLTTSTTFERIFDTEKLEIERLRHKFQPTLTYTFRPYQDKRDYDPWFEEVDRWDRTNIISFSLKNIVDARRQDKRGHATYSQGASFQITQDYDVDEAREDKKAGRKKPFLPLKGSVYLTPYPGLDLRANANWDHYKSYISSGSVALDLEVKRSGKRYDNYEVDFVYDRHSSKNLNYSFNINLDYGFSLGAEGRKDLIKKHDIQNSYWVDYQSQCWGIRMVYDEVDEDERAMIVFRLSGIGDVGSFHPESAWETIREY